MPYHKQKYSGKDLLVFGGGGVVLKQKVNPPTPRPSESGSVADPCGWEIHQQHFVIF